MEDILQQLGYLTLGTRLKRIGERMQADAQRIFASFDLTIPAAQWPFLAALDRLGPLSIGELAQAVGVTQPGVTRTVAQLSEAGLAAVVSSGEDQRRKKVSLTAEGRRLVNSGKKAVWPVLESAVAGLCDELTGPLLSQLEALECGLTEKPLYQRAGRGIGRAR
jgi:DNA-binding MarR family transcriptional regulator